MLGIRLGRFYSHLAGSTALCVLSAGAASAQSVVLHLPAQPLSVSLMAVAEKTGESIIFSQQSLGGIQAPALDGLMSAQQAVERLISGTNLEIAHVGDRALVVRPVAERPNDASNAPSALAGAPGAQARSAQTQSAPSETARHGNSYSSQLLVEQVVVSASRITIAGYSQPTPVTVIGAALLEQDGYANIADSVRNLPQVTSPPSSFGTSQAAATAGTAGTNLVNLRNLGFPRTLVLFDSQRVVASSLFSSGVDTTTFPQTLIERVDIVTGGASAAWGSDAVAGVVNFVLNRNFTGFKATIQASDTYNGLDRGLSGNATWGGEMDGGRGHLEFAASGNINPDTVLLSQERWFKGAYWVSNPAYVAGNGQPQLIVGTNVGLANATVGGLITASPVGIAAPGVTVAATNALRGLQFVGNGVPQAINFGNVTLGTLSNGGSLTDTNSQAPIATIATPNNIYTLFGYGRYRLTDTIQASAQMNYGYFTGKATNPPPSQTALTIRSDNAYLPASVAATMQAGGITSFTLGTLNINNYDPNAATGASYHAQAEGSLGVGTQFVRRNILRGVFTLEGTLSDDWSWNAYIQHSAVRIHANFLGDPIAANLAAAQDAVTVTTANRGNSGLALGGTACRSTLTGAPVTVSGINSQPGCIPLDVFGTGVASPAAIGYITGTSSGAADYAKQSLEQDVMEASMQGTLPWQLPAGKVAVAFGMGYRKEAGRVVTSPLGAYAGYTQADFTSFPSRDYNVMEGFAEVDAPILKNTIVNALDFSMAGRMTSYSTSGLVETWKLGATSQINEDIKLRTTWSVDIRAPQLYDLFSQANIGIVSQRDPKTQATVTVTQITAGNPNLVPEVARTISGGVVLTPTFVPGLSLSADWYSINLTGEIAALAAATILNQCNASSPSAIYPGTNGNPNDPLCSILCSAVRAECCPA